jgi:hypothetical protein
MYQNSTIAATYGTMGYLVTIVASLSMCILPRAKLVQLTIQNTVRSQFPLLLNSQYPANITALDRRLPWFRDSPIRPLDCHNCAQP